MRLAKQYPWWFAATVAIFLSSCVGRSSPAEPDKNAAPDKSAAEVQAIDDQHAEKALLILQQREVEFRQVQRQARKEFWGALKRNSNVHSWDEATRGRWVRLQRRLRDARQDLLQLGRCNEDSFDRYLALVDADIREVRDNLVHLAAR